MSAPSICASRVVTNTRQPLPPTRNHSAWAAFQTSSTTSNICRSASKLFKYFEADSKVLALKASFDLSNSLIQSPNKVCRSGLCPKVTHKIPSANRVCTSRSCTNAAAKTDLPNPPKPAIALTTSVRSSTAKSFAFNAVKASGRST